MTGPAPLEGAREALRAEIEKTWHCTCHEAYKTRNRIDPQCPFCDYIEDVLDAIPTALSSAGYQVVKVEEQRTEYAVRYYEGSVSIRPDLESTRRAEGYDLGSEAVQRSVGPWVPVSGEQPHG